MFLLSGDEDTLTGMRLAGVEGVFVKDREEFVSAAEKAADDENTGILLVTKTLGEEFPEEMVQLKKKGNVLITEIPDMKNPDVPSDSITRYVRDAVGVNLE